MMEETTPVQPDSLVEDELVDDRALDRFEADQFGHRDFVHELVGVIRNARTPASVALFGPWGSGKTGIANMLAHELSGNSRTIRFVSFDASKYAETPLRRHFISQVATGLDITASEFHDDLYRDREDRNINFRSKNWKGVAGWAVGVTLGIAALVFGAAVCVALFLNGPTGNNIDRTTDWVANAGAVVYLALPVSALLVAAVKLIIDGITVGTKRTAPSGDEEFEARFRDLVAAARTKRLVVFIDELDRCSPAQVASTLETLKTFLFVRGCVFVVGADQQVLEQALRRKARQHTPEDTTNPYYSAGSSYLDKVFQYQLTLPPLRSPVLSRFALGLVEKSPGVWQRVEGLEEAVSVLVPTHVTSPRRVKVLLNRFALAYRLAERRAAEGRLDPGFARRASELAKLVCLQCEFPLFAEDLTLDSRLPDLVRRLADDEQLPREVRPDIRLRAEAYAAGRLSVAEYLVDGRAEPLSQLLDGLSALAAAGTSRVDSSDEDLNDEEEDPADGDDVTDVDAEPDATASSVARRHAQQLISYLRKTSYVRGPGADLLYLESAGALHGIDPVHADRLQRAALDNDRREVLRLVEQAAEEKQGRGALLVLADVVRQGEPGVGGRNVVNALMQSIERGRVQLDSAAAEYIADAVAGHMTRTELGGEDLLGALRLAAVSKRDVAMNLRAAVLSHPDSTRRSDVATELLAHAGEVPATFSRPLADATATALLQAPTAAAQQLMALPEATAPRVLVAAERAVQRAGSLPYTELKAQAEERARTGEEPSTVIDGPLPHETLAEALDLLLERPKLANVLATQMLSIGESELREAVLERIPHLAPIQDEPLIDAILSATYRARLGDVPKWLAPLDETTISAHQALGEMFDAVGCAVWRSASDENAAPSEIDDALAAMGRISARVTIRADLEHLVQRETAKAFSTDDAVDAQGSLRELATKFVGAGVLDERFVADCDLSSVGATLEAGLPSAIPRPSRERVDGELLKRVNEAAPRASSDALRQGLEAVTEDNWLSDVERVYVRVHLARALRNEDGSVDEPLDETELTSLAGLAHDDVIADEALSCWLDGFATDPEAVWEILAPLATHRLPSSTAEALGRFVGRLDGTQHLAFVDRVLFTGAADAVDSSVLSALKLSEVNGQQFGDRLIKLYADANNIRARRTVMELWTLFKPTSPSVRRKLVDEVYVPLVRTGAGGFELAVTHFGLVATVDGVRRLVRDALRDAATTDRDQRRVEKKFEEAGWTTRRLLRGKKDL